MTFDEVFEVVEVGLINDEDESTSIFYSLNLSVLQGGGRPLPCFRLDSYKPPPQTTNEVRNPSSPVAICGRHKKPYV